MGWENWKKLDQQPKKDFYKSRKKTQTEQRKKIPARTEKILNQEHKKRLHTKNGKPTRQRTEKDTTKHWNKNRPAPLEIWPRRFLSSAPRAPHPSYEWPHLTTLVEGLWLGWHISPTVPRGITKSAKDKNITQFLSLSLSLFSFFVRFSVLAQVGRFPHNLSPPSISVLC